MNNKPDEKPYPFRQGEFGLSEDVLRAVPLAGLSAPILFADKFWGYSTGSESQRIFVTRR